MATLVYAVYRCFHDVGHPIQIRRQRHDCCRTVTAQRGLAILLLHLYVMCRFCLPNKDKNEFGPCACELDKYRETTNTPIQEWTVNVCSERSLTGESTTPKESGVLTQEPLISQLLLSVSSVSEEQTN